jgi:hypothetical protein
VGKGRPVRVLVTSRRLMRGPPISYNNCDDGRDVSVLLWRLVAAGEAFTVTSEIRCVCFQQGHGAFPQVDMLSAQQRCKDAEGRIRVVVDTEAP